MWPASAARGASLAGAPPPSADRRLCGSAVRPHPPCPARATGHRSSSRRARRPVSGAGRDAPTARCRLCLHGPWPRANTAPFIVRWRIVRAAPEMADGDGERRPLTAPRRTTGRWVAVFSDRLTPPRPAPPPGVPWPRGCNYTFSALQRWDIKGAFRDVVVDNLVCHHDTVLDISIETTVFHFFSFHINKCLSIVLYHSLYLKSAHRN